MMIKTFAIYITLAAFVFMASTQLYTFIMQHRDPMHYDRVWTDTTVVKLGGVFRARYALTRLRTCRAEIATIMEREDTHEAVRRDKYEGGARLPGVYDDIPLVFTLPPPSELGCYLFSTTAVNYCNEGTHVIQAPTLRFCVVAGESAK